MKISRSRIALHLSLTVGVTALVVFCIFYPFFPGSYDALAVPLSGLAQVFGITGLLFVPVGVLWLLNELWGKGSRRYYFAVAAIVIASMIVFAIALGLSVGSSIAAGALTLIGWMYVLWKLIPKLKALKNSANGNLNPIPLYLIVVPIGTVVLQLLLASPSIEFSRNYAIEQSENLIRDIERYRASNGEYPESLFAEWQDYDLPVVGIAQYHYARDGETYNLAFRMPSFLHKNPGTIEFVIYNPRDEHLMLGHDSDILRWEPDVLHERQGWYAAHDTAYPHWKYFWFD